MHGPPSQPNRPSISIGMTDQDVVERVASLLGTKVGKRWPATFQQKGWKPVFYTVKKGQPAVDLMQVLLPMMGLRRQERIREVVARYVPRRRGQKMP